MTDNVRICPECVTPLTYQKRYCSTACYTSARTVAVLDGLPPLLPTLTLESRYSGLTISGRYVDHFPKHWS